MQGGTAARTRPIFWHWTGKAAEPDWWPRLAVRDGDWKLALDDAKRAALFDLAKDRAEATNVAKDHPEIVARLTKLALAWKATLPEKPNPDCVSKSSAPVKSDSPKPTTKGVTPKVRAKAFERWDINKDSFLTLDEYRPELKDQDNLESRFKSFDKNGDGKLSREEFVGPTGK
jgi:hypothetical protein